MENKDLSPKTQKIFKFLQEWQAEFHLYDLMDFHSMEIYDELEAEDYLENMWDYDLTKYFNDKFYSFSTEGGTGYFAFWHYKNLQGEAPIVLLANSGGDPIFLAANLNDLVCKMIHQIGFNGGWWCREDDDEKPLEEPTEEDFDDMYDQVADNYQDENNKEISIEKAKILLEKDRQDFKERALKLIDFISEKEINENIKKHPCFVDRVSQFNFKNTELFYLKHEIKNEEELLKLLNVFKKEINDKYYPTTKEQVIAGIKGNYPKYYKSSVFEKWLADLDKPPSEEELKAKEEVSKNISLIADYTDLYLDGKIKTSYLKGFQDKYPEISKQVYFQNWIKKSKEKNIDALLKNTLED
jgi:hypothetical protein